MSAPQPSSSPRVRALAAALRLAREEANVGQRDLTRRLGLTHPQLSYIERGIRTASVELVAAILQELHVVGAAKDRILELAKNATELNWLDSGAPGMSEGLAYLLDCETTASSITEWTYGAVPGLLQISDYARVILERINRVQNAGRPATSNKVQSQLMMRMGRRDILTRPNPTHFTALIDEQAIREVVGSPEIQINQLAHVLDMAKRPNVEVLVVQSGHGWHPGKVGPFVIYDFADVPSTVLHENFSSSALVYEPRDVEAIQSAARDVRGLAMSSADSVELIAGVINELTEKTTT